MDPTAQHIAKGGFIVFARSSCGEAIQLSFSRHQSWIASLRSQ
jgi:hypothetical protein